MGANDNLLPDLDEALGFDRRSQPSLSQHPALRVSRFEFSSRGDRVPGRLLLPESGDGRFPLVQSFVAVGRGGSLGVGLGGGRQKLFSLPEGHTDFILSVGAEELGLVGVLVVLGAFAALIVAGTRIARRARDPFALLVAFAACLC